jgi:hypothetical protein
MAVLILVLFLLISTIHVGSESLTAYTDQPNQIHYVSSPNTRGTLDILWSCIFTILACTWTIQHLNIPEQRNARDPGWTGDWKWEIKSLWTNIKWMLATMLAPEYILGKGLADLSTAFKSMREMEGYAQTDWVEWKLTHGFFANMGGFVLNQTRAMKSDDTKAAVEGEGIGTRRPVGKDLEKGVVKRDDMKPDSGALDGPEESKAENPPNVSQQERREIFEDGQTNTEIAGRSTTTAREAINDHDPEHSLPRYNEEGMGTNLGKQAQPSSPAKSYNCFCRD